MIIRATIALGIEVPIKQDYSLISSLPRSTSLGYLIKELQTLVLPLEKRPFVIPLALLSVLPPVLYPSLGIR